MLKAKLLGLEIQVRIRKLPGLDRQRALGLLWLDFLFDGFFGERARHCHEMGALVRETRLACEVALEKAQVARLRLAEVDTLLFGLLFFGWFFGNVFSRLRRKLLVGAGVVFSVARLRAGLLGLAGLSAQLADRFSVLGRLLVEKVKREVLL